MHSFLEFHLHIYILLITYQMLYFPIKRFPRVSCPPKLLCQMLGWLLTLMPDVRRDTWPYNNESLYYNQLETSLYEISVRL